jgi:hypothetical protein
MTTGLAVYFPELADVAVLSFVRRKVSAFPLLLILVLNQLLSSAAQGLSGLAYSLRTTALK